MLRWRERAGPPLASFFGFGLEGVLNDGEVLVLVEREERAPGLVLGFPDVLLTLFAATRRDCIWDSRFESKASFLYLWYHSVNDCMSYTSGGP